MQFGQFFCKVIVWKGVFYKIKEDQNPLPTFEPPLPTSHPHRNVWHYFINIGVKKWTENCGGVPCGPKYLIRHLVKMDTSKHAKLWKMSEIIISAKCATAYFDLIRCYQALSIIKEETSGCLEEVQTIKYLNIRVTRPTHCTYKLFL